MENTILVSICYVLFVMSTVRIVKVEEVEILIVFICWCLLGYVALRGFLTTDKIQTPTAIRGLR